MPSSFNLLSSGTVESYSFDENKWSSLTPLPRKLRSVASCIDEISQITFVTGGLDYATGEASSSIYYLQHAAGSDDADSWRVVGALRSPRYRHASIFFRGHVWTVGGVGLSFTALSLQSFRSSVPLCCPPLFISPLSSLCLSASSFLST